jgi:hypothetical protein
MVGLDVEYKRETTFKDDSETLDLNNWQDGAALAELKRPG